jgi:hypothetical protein
MQKALGRRHTDRTRPVLRMGAHLTTAAFQTPPAIDYASRIDPGVWLLGQNDVFGTCGPTSVANYALLTSTVLAADPLRFTDEEIFDLYRRSGNPDFDPATGADDNGVEMTVMLSELVRNGIGSGGRNVKALAFGKLNAYEPAETWAAGATLGGALWGMDLDVAQSRQFDRDQPWDYVKGSSAWGGHAVLAAHRYSDVEGTLADRTGLVTWARMTDSTSAFITRQVPESYAVIWPWHLGSKQFLEGIDLFGLAQEFTELTGRPFPAAVVPPVPPAPSPEPVSPTAPVFPVQEWEAFTEHPWSIPKRKRAVEAVDAYRAAL